MTMEKRGVISNEDTPQPGTRVGKMPTKPKFGEGILSKEAADQLQQSPINNAIDAVASQTAKNQSK